jgi:hypothetical protein
VVAVLVSAGVGGTFAGFVDTEVSEGNFVQAGISDLLVNGKNDPIGPKLRFTHATPGKSTDFWIDLFNWGRCQGGDVYFHIKDVESYEAGVKIHNGKGYVYTGNPLDGGGDIPVGYREAVSPEPKGAGVWSSEPEKISEVGDGYIGQFYIAADDPGVFEEDYASGVSEHLDVTVEVPIRDVDGFLGNPDDIVQNPDVDNDREATDIGNGQVSADEFADWITNGNTWRVVLSGKLAQIECNKVLLGFLVTQEMTFIHIDVVIQQIADPSYPRDYDGNGVINTFDEQKKWWPTNALQGDIAEWSMLFELTTDP